MDPIEKATWALVLATGLLVLATAIPAVAALIDGWKRKTVLVARLIPELGFLKDRMASEAERLSRPALTLDELEFFQEELDEELEILSPLVQEGPLIGFAFMEELLLCRHLVTQARIEGDFVEMAWDNPGNQEVKARQEHIDRAIRLCLAASKSLEAAALKLPLIAGRYRKTSFGDRLSELSRTREAAAEKELVDRKYEPPRTARRPL